MSLALQVPRALLLALLAWQAAAAAVGEAQNVARTADRPWSTRLCAGTSERVGAVLGADAHLLTLLRAHAPSGTLVCTDAVTGDLAAITPERFAQLMHENGVIAQLKALLYPAPWLLDVPNARAVAEDLAARGRAVMLWVRAGQPEPVDAERWSRVHTEPGASLWRCRKG